MRKEKRGREHNEKKGRDRVRGDIEDERQRENRWRVRLEDIGVGKGRERAETRERVGGEER